MDCGDVRLTLRLAGRLPIDLGIDFHRERALLPVPQPFPEMGKIAESPTRLWLREHDLNQRPSGYEPDDLPDCGAE